jgi:predicted nuclease of predicted toxin-antitoxin system
MRFLLDENLPARYRDLLYRANPELSLRRVGQADAPPHGTTDPAILAWCEEHDFLLVTGNRRSMPGHLQEHLAAQRHVPGILIVRRRAAMTEVVGSLLLIAGASLPGEFRDRIEYVPLR